MLNKKISAFLLIISFGNMVKAQEETTASTPNSNAGPGLNIGHGQGTGTSPGQGTGTSPGQGTGTHPASDIHPGPGIDSGTSSGVGPGSLPFPDPGGSRPKPILPPLPKGCDTITGKWYNEYGSLLDITQNQNGSLSGYFYTLRESNPSSSAGVRANIVGTAAYVLNSVMFSFAIGWGQHTTTWTGQCYKCGKEEKLETNWLMREPVKDCLDKWHANRFGHSAFTKTPPPYLSTEEIATDKLQPLPPWKKFEPKTNCSSLEGVWFNDLGAKLDVEDKDGILKGLYQLPPPIKMRIDAGVYGVSTYSADGTFGFISLNEEGRVITSWVGQCLMCAVGNETVEMLDTYVANRLWVSTCFEEFRTTAFGVNRFTRKNYASKTPTMPLNDMQENPPHNEDNGMGGSPPKIPVGTDLNSYHDNITTTKPDE